MAESSRLLLFALLACLGCKPSDPPATGLIEDPYPLREILNEAERIAVGSVESFAADGRSAVLRMERPLRGSPLPEIRLSSLGEPRLITGERFDLRRHAVPGSPVVFFAKDGAGLLYVNRFFVMLYGGSTPESWALACAERHLNQTFVGSARELADLIPRALSGEASPPPPDPRRFRITGPALDALPPPGVPFDDEYAKGPFAATLPPRAEALAADRTTTVSPGLRRASFAEKPKANSALDAMTPARIDVVPGIEFPPPAEAPPGTWRFQGFVEVPADGTYAFWIRSEGWLQVELRLGNPPASLAYAITSDGERAVDVPLRTGRHALDLRILGYGGAEPPRLLWSGPGLRKAVVPAAAFSHRP
jgi:hypothetical protein